MAFAIRNGQISGRENSANEANIVKPVGKNALAPVLQGPVRQRTALGEVGNFALPSSLAPRPKGLKMAQTTEDFLTLSTINEKSTSLNSTTGMGATAAEVVPTKVSRPTYALPRDQATGVSSESAIQQVTVLETTINTTQNSVLLLNKRAGEAGDVTETATLLRREVTAVTSTFSRQRLADVPDIDANDTNVRDFLATDYVNDIMNYLRLREVKFVVPAGYLDDRKYINARMRGVLLDWLVDVHFQFNFSQETLFTCQKILDVYLMINDNVTRTELQLVGVTCLYLAAKFEEVYTPAIRDFVSICDNAYTQEQIKRTEFKLLHSLKFEILAPLPCMFLRRFSKAAKADLRLHTMAKYFMEVALVDYELVDLKASESASAALALSLMIMRRSSLESVWNTVLQHYTQYSVLMLKPSVLRLANVIIRVHEEPKLKAVKSKYSRQKNFLRIARAPELSLENWKDSVLKHLENNPRMLF